MLVTGQNRRKNRLLGIVPKNSTPVDFALLAADMVRDILRACSHVWLVHTASSTSVEVGWQRGNSNYKPLHRYHNDLAEE